MRKLKWTTHADMAITHKAMLWKSPFFEHLPAQITMADVRVTSRTADLRRIGPADTDIVKHRSFKNKIMIQAFMGKSPGNFEGKICHRFGMPNKNAVNGRSGIIAVFYNINRVHIQIVKIAPIRSWALWQ